ncbi:MAG: Asp-tRNA(Asn)/Glu-tRNA(Gln) amidotransferase subunit GatB [Leptothrix sp. (in: b-proteobacteria)]
MTQSLLVRGYEVVIGFETHAQLSTHSKIFSGASTEFGAEPNTQACAVDLALPGSLPVMNRGAVERAIQFGLAVGADIAPMSIFARKNYFYPDLPKGYQISQYEIPVVQGGVVEFYVDGVKHRVNLTRAHLEEDAGKSLHDEFHGMSGIDLNRAGTPLLEIVTEPDLRSSRQAVEYAKALHTLVVWLGICDGNMMEGSFRCDANVSVRRLGEPFGTRREIKNLNSFRFLQQAIDFEVNWQIDQIEDGYTIQQATVLFDPDSGETRMMRTKEDAHDYRYFPDPDLPPLVIAPEWVERVRGALPELPGALAARFQAEDGLPAYDAAMMTASRATAAYYQAAASACGQPKLVANWIMGEISKRLNADGGDISGSPVSPSQLAALIGRITDGTISNNAAKQLFDVLWAAGEIAGHSLAEGYVNRAAEDLARIDALIDEKGLKQMNDSGALEAIIDSVLAANQKSVDEYRAGKDKAFNALVGQIMKASKGKANPAQANELLKKKLG